MNASMIIKRAQVDGVKIVLSPTGSLKLSGEAANVLRWASVVQTHKTEIIGALERPAVHVELLEAARQAYREHLESCPICSTGWAATSDCVTHSELWPLYEAALVGVHGAYKVLGPETPTPPDTVSSPSNGYKAVPTAHIKPPSWIEARDTYYHHWFTCRHCTPSGMCSEGEELRETYNQQHSLTESIT